MSSAAEAARRGLTFAVRSLSGVRLHEIHAVASLPTCADEERSLNSSPTALCPQAPITGPATFIVFTLGPFLNLVMVLILTQEAPYNLALTTIGTDGVRPGRS